MTIPTSDPDAVDYAARIRITAGEPTPVEVAAVTAVVAAALEQLAAEERVQAPTNASAWERGRRTIRRPLARGDWRSFGR
ncbi:acyl-CoA carboxylase epsilon subunit [Pseudolysinimonas sp.]|uniref:acyl-CoA carboxylase epsilon subunit n=1 Tax=Pseudolysinimonas sp. TaxID=2680009 RepID=UPI003F7ECD04